VQDLSAMHVLEGFQELIDDELLVDLFQNVGSDHSMKVCFYSASRVKKRPGTPQVFGFLDFGYPCVQRPGRCPYRCLLS